MPAIVLRPPDVPSRRRRWWPAAVFVLAVVALMPRSLAGQATFLAVDMVEARSPYRDALGRAPEVISPTQTDHVEHLPLTIKFFDELRSGSVQRWDPAIGGGSPTLTAYPWLPSPFNIGHLVGLPDWYAATLHAALTLLVGQVLMYLLLRRLGTGRGAATFAGVAYAFSGTHIVFLQRPLGAAWILPGLLWAIHRCVDRPSTGRVLAVGGFVAWTWYEGFPSAFVYCTYVSVAWAAWSALGVTEGQPRAVARATEALRRLVPTGLGFAWGLALAAATMVPFLGEVSRRGLLERRSTDLHSHLPPVHIGTLLDLTVNGDPLDPSSTWAGVNPFESVSTVGSVVLFAAAVGMVAAVVGRLPLAPAGRLAWPFFAVLAPLISLLVFVGTRLLGWAYLLPGVGSNPIGRARFLIALGAVVLAALHVDAVMVRAARRTQPVRRAGAAAAVGLWAFVLAASLDDLWRGVRDAGKVRELAGGLLVAALLAGVAALAVLAAKHRIIAPAAAGTALAAIVFLQVAQPLRGFTPESPVSAFYPDLAAHEELRRLSGGDGRFAATGFEFYPNSAQIQGLLDLRGIVLYGEEMRALLESASPATFDRDPIKQVMTREEWQLGAPAYDVLALRWFALATAEEPFGDRVDLDEPTGRWVQLTDREMAIDLPPGRVLSGFATPLRATGDCADAHVSVELADPSGTVHDEARRPATDAAGDWLAVALVGDRAGSDPSAALDLHDPDGGCRVEVGVAGTGEPARRLYLDDPDDAVTLRATEQGWIYERPTGRAMVSALTAWHYVDDDRAAIFGLRGGGGEATTTARVVGSGEDEDSGGAAAIMSRSIGQNQVTVEVDVRGRALVVLSQDAAEGWGVSVDGRSAPLERVDGAVMGVFVDDGRHDVVFSYRPPGLRFAVMLTAGALLVGAAAAALERRRIG